jgi:hypothetical protein
VQRTGGCRLRGRSGDAASSTLRARGPIEGQAHRRRGIDRSVPAQLMADRIAGDAIGLRAGERRVGAQDRVAQEPRQLDDGVGVVVIEDHRTSIHRSVLAAGT